MDILRGEDIFLRNYSSGILEKSALFKKSPDRKKTIYIKIPVESIRPRSEAVMRRIIQAALEKILGGLEDISYRNIEDILGLVQTDTGENKWLKPISEVMVFRINGFIYMAHTGFTDDLDPDIQSYICERSGEPGKDEEHPGQTLKIGGQTLLSDFSLSVMSKIIDDPGKYRALPHSKAIIDYGKVLPPIRVRRWRDGDRFYPLGLKGSKKLQDFFTDNKIPVNRRKKIPVFCDREKIIWIGNMRIDTRVRITPGTSDFLYLELFEK
jgi:tRNA(Ile)-lysidine synthase